MAVLIRCNDKRHPQFGAVWAVSGLTRTPVRAEDYDRWKFLAGEPAEEDGAAFDWWMRNTTDISHLAGVTLTVFYIRTVIDRIAKALKVPT